MKPTPLLAGVVFGLLGFAGNWFKYELFFNLDLLFGSFFVFLALLRFGAGAGVIAGVIASTATYFLWHHPWYAVILTAEVLAVTWFHEKRRLDPTVAMVLFWLLPGPLLIWLLFHLVLAAPLAVTALFILKGAVNSILNVLLAMCVHLIILAFFPKNDDMAGYREFIATFMLALVLFPAAIFMAFEIRADLAKHLEDASRRCTQTAKLARTSVDSWISDNHQHLQALALLIGDPQQRSAVEMQRQAEVFLESTRSFKRIGVVNRAAVSVAYAPSVDAQGNSTIGLNFSDRPYLALVRERQKPFVGDVQMSRVGPSSPELPLLVPMGSGNDYQGFCGGVIDLSWLNDLLKEIVGSRTLTITLLDRNGAVVTSTDPKREMMKPWPRSGGELRRLSGDVSQWIPEAKPGTAVMSRWIRSYYFSETRVSPVIGWTVVVEASLLPALASMAKTANRLFGIMAALILFVSGMALFVSRWQSRPLVALQALTERVAGHPELAVEDTWPGSPIREIDALSRNFRRMADSLHHTVAELFTLNSELEKTVTLRTDEFRKSEERLRLALAAARQGWFDLDCRTGEATVSPEYARLLGYEPAEFVANLEHWVENMHPEDRPGVLAAYRQCLESGEAAAMEYRRRHKTGDWLWISSTGKVIEYDSEHKPVRMIGIHADITGRKQVEEALRELNRTLETRVEAETLARLEKERMLIQQSKMAAMGEMIGAIAHQWRQPLNAVAVIAQDIKDAFAVGSLDRAYLHQAVGSAMSQVLFMSKTIDDFRDFFRPDKAKTTFDAKKAMARVIKMMAGQYWSHGIHCSITCQVHGKTYGPGEPVEICNEMRITGFKNELQQVFLNLLDNAKDAILESRRAPGAPDQGRINVVFDREAERVVIRIADNGGGIPADIVDRVFEPYFTTKEQGKGTGIGLYMAKMIIENNMGGRIAARNVEEGAEFTIVI